MTQKLTSAHASSAMGYYSGWKKVNRVMTEFGELGVLQRGMAFGDITIIRFIGRSGLDPSFFGTTDTAVANALH